MDFRADYEDADLAGVVRHAKHLKSLERELDPLPADGDLKSLMRRGCLPLYDVTSIGWEAKAEWSLQV